MEDIIKAIINSNQIKIVSHYTKIDENVILNAIVKNEDIKSPFRVDSHPSVRVIVTNSKYGKKIFFKDLANSSFDKDLFDIVGYYLNKSTKNKSEFVDIIYTIYDRLISKNTMFSTNDLIDIEPNKYVVKTINEKSKIEFDFKIRSVDNDDLDYWNQYSLPMDYVIAKNYMFVESYKCIIDGIMSDTGYKYHFRNPCYAYYSSTNEGVNEFKLNFPFADKTKRFRTNIKTVIECLYEIQEANIVIICKSRKDNIYLQYYIYKQGIRGVSVINVRSENVKFTEDYIRLVKNISNSRIVFYDGDDIGKSHAISLVNDNIADKYIYINEYTTINKHQVFIKDPTDMNKYKGLTYTYNKLDNLFKLIL